MITDARIRWKCRRGMLELDKILETFCQEILPEMDDASKADFFEFLDTPDQVLWDYVFEQSLPEKPSDVQFVLRLRAIDPKNTIC